MRSYDIPEGVEVSVEGDHVRVKGPKGETRHVMPKGVQVRVENGQFVAEGIPMTEGTAVAHVRNMIKGVTEGYTKRLKILYSHFPMKVEIKGKDVVIRNFLGRKKEIVTKIVGDVKVSVKGQEIVVEGVSKDDVGQTAANLIQATKIRKLDRRVFQDGIYPVIG